MHAYSQTADKKAYNQQEQKEGRRKTTLTLFDRWRITEIKGIVQGTES